MKREKEIAVKKILVTLSLSGKKKPVTKSALVCVQTGKIIKFLDVAS